MSIDDIIIRGIAHRGACDPEIATYVAGASPAAETLPLYPQLHQHTTMGSAAVRVLDNGDIEATATVPKHHVSWLYGYPFLGVTIDDPEDGPRRIIQVAVTDNILDPLQLPYRVIQYTDDFAKDFSFHYDPVVVVDEKHDSNVQLNADGSVAPVFDITKTHTELRHRTERLRIALPDAIARGFGFESWTPDLEMCDECDELPMTLRVLREVMRTL